MKRVFSLLLPLLWAVVVMAAPARPAKQTITLPDGTTREVTLCGDERLHYWQAADGTAYRQDADGCWTTVDVEEAATRAASRFCVPRKVQTRATTDEERQNFKGTKRGLVILVEFPNLKLKYSRQEFDDFFNQPGYSKNGSVGSVRDYFLAQSYGQFSIDFDVLGPVTVSREYSYYGKNDANGDDMYVASMVIEAVKLVNAEVNFADYDWDGDKEVDQVYLVYAGYSEAGGAPANTIWPQEFNLETAKLYGDGIGAVHLDGVKINTFAVSNELIGTSGTKMDGPGVVCHEFSHCLGLPDFYDTVGNSFGMHVWDLMDSGCYLGNGYAPCGYTSYERWYCGWLELQELTSYTEVADMPALSEQPVAYVVRNKYVPTEYYLFENRQQIGWDTELYGAGMLVLHVDYSASAWANNTVNNTSSRQRMTIVPADNSRTTTAVSLRGDVWPGTAQKTELTNTSFPAATLYNKNTNGTKFLNFPIRNIAMNRWTGTISFTAGDKPLSIAPVAEEAQHDASCHSYDLQGRPVAATRAGVHIIGNRKVLNANVR